MFDEETHEKLVNWYKHPAVMEVQFTDKKKKKVKCWTCHHDPCICHLIKI